jgi:DNA-binding NarL/FixJ family response regulator
LSETPETATQDRSAARVVLADDDVLLREGLASLLDRFGFDVVGQVGNGTELLALVRSVRPDLAIIDIRMPPTHATEGLQVARVIREELPGTAIIVLSAHVEVDQAMELLAGGQGLVYLL